MKEYRIQDNAGNYAVILPEKGATVLKLVSNGVDVFYQNMENILSAERPRCGVPFLFPAFGRTQEDSSYPLPIHGFGHISEWTVMSYVENELVLELNADATTRKVYPFEFCVELRFLIKEGRLSIYQTYENKDSREMPYGFGFHPYFAVDPIEVETMVDAALEMSRYTGQVLPFDKRPVRIEFPEGAAEGGTFFLQAKTGAVLHGKEKQIHIEFDENFDKLVFWAVVGKEFLCVEPINIMPNGLTTGDCYTLAPGEKREACISFYANKY